MALWVASEAAAASSHGYQQIWARINSLWPSDTILGHISGSTLAQVMSWCHQAPRYYLNQCWLIIRGLLWHSPESHFRAAQTPLLYKGFENYTLRITATSPRSNKLTFLVLRWECSQRTWYHGCWYCGNTSGLIDTVLPFTIEIAMEDVGKISL